MGSFKPPRAFNSQDLETIQWVYEAAWAQIVLRDPSRDTRHDAELQAFLRKRIFAFAQSSPVDFDTLYGHRRSTIPLERTFLHAARLILTIPGEKAPRTFSAPLPPELEGVLRTLIRQESHL